MYLDILTCRICHEHGSNNMLKHGTRHWVHHDLLHQ